MTGEACPKANERGTYSSKFIQVHNAAALVKSIELQSQEQVYSIYINFPALLLRKKSPEYPTGRTTIRFKAALRRKVTMVDKNHNRIDQNQIKNLDKTDLDEAEQELDNI